MGGGSTIFALASAPGRAGIAVIRLSGPGSGAAVEQLTGKPLPPPRRAVLRRFSHGGAVIDEGLLLWFAGPESFTGEDVAELQLHGGRAVQGALFGALAEMGLAPAEPGEFSRRAVENGRLDLTRAEAIADLVDAETESQRRAALRQYDGALADLYEGWRAALIRALGRAEAAIDFSDDGVGETEFVAARTAAAKIATEIAAHLDDGRRGEALREGLRLAIVGPPNAGKSSLINALAQREAAIVSETPGTTRDVIELRLNLGGYLVHVADTAGLRETEDVIEAEGVRRARAAARDADLTLLLLDGRDAALTDIPADLIVRNKSDLPGFEKSGGIALSLKTGDGLGDVLTALSALIGKRLETKDQSVSLSRPRHRRELEIALEMLQRSGAAKEVELFAEDLRLGMRALGRITGRVDVEELLDFVFKDFCIGK